LHPLENCAFLHGIAYFPNLHVSRLYPGFGSQGIIPSNDRAEQRKLVKYMHLVANCVIFHNVQAVSQILHTLQHTGEAVPPDAIGALSPYLTEHVNRLGTYTLDLAQIPSALNYDLLQPQAATPNAVQQALWSEAR